MKLTTAALVAQTIKVVTDIANKPEMDPDYQFILQRKMADLQANPTATKAYETLKAAQYFAQEAGIA